MSYLQVEDERKPQLEGQFSGKGFQCLCFPKVFKHEKNCARIGQTKREEGERGNETVDLDSRLHTMRGSEITGAIFAKI